MNRLGLCFVFAMAIAGLQLLHAQSLPASQPEPQFVVALFRHGVRAPLKEFADHANDYAGQCWPAKPSDWGAKHWGDLTAHGQLLAVHVGEYYSDRYRNSLPPPFRVFLWTDVDDRTLATAEALATGFRKRGVAPKDVMVASRPVTVRPDKDADRDPDPLFHPFKAGCGTPERYRLDAIARFINIQWADWAKRDDRFAQLSRVLACPTEKCTKTCTPLERVQDVATAWAKGEERKSPIKWKSTSPDHPGLFPYGSSASEAFLLEYANHMLVGWGNVSPPNPAAKQYLAAMMGLHEFYFDKTERDSYLALIDGSNVVREISDQLNRQAGRATRGQCPRGDKDARFIGLVGHDTNLATVGALLNIHWSFSGMPPEFGMRDLPNDDALPAGALVFELYKQSGVYSIRVVYITQSPRQMYDGGSGELFPLLARCTINNKEKYPCDLSLDEFNDLVAGALGKDNYFLTTCSTDGKEQLCK